MSRLDDAISQLGEDLKSIAMAIAPPVQELSASDDPSVRNIEISQTEELMTVASDLLQRVASVAGTLSTRSEVTRSKVTERPVTGKLSTAQIFAEPLVSQGNQVPQDGYDQVQEDEDGISILGGPLTKAHSQNISFWVSNLPEATDPAFPPTELSLNSPAIRPSAPPSLPNTTHSVRLSESSSMSISPSAKPSLPNTTHSVRLGESSSVSVYTMPSTVGEKHGLSLSHGITMVRMKRIKQFMNEGLYQRALPLLENLAQSTLGDDNASEASKAEISHLFSVAVIEADPLGKTAQSFADKFPSIQEEVAKKLSANGAALASAGSFAEAEPLLRASLKHVRHLVRKGAASAEIRRSEGELEIQVAEALAALDCTDKEAESLLNKALESGQFDGATRSRCAYYMTKMFFERSLLDMEKENRPWNFKFINGKPRKDPRERHTNQVSARKYCLMAAEGRDAAMGREHPATQQAIALMTHICTAMGDLEEMDIWREFLLSSPENYLSYQFIAYDIYLTTVADGPEGLGVWRGRLDFLTSSYEFCLSFLDLTEHFRDCRCYCCTECSREKSKLVLGTEPCAFYHSLPAHGDAQERFAADTLAAPVRMAGSKRRDGAECIAEINYLWKAMPGWQAAEGLLTRACLKAAAIAGNPDTVRAIAYSDGWEYYRGSSSNSYFALEVASDLLEHAV